MLPLTPALMRYDWGSPHGIPELLGFDPDGGPWAEAWWGAHPLAPSTTPDGPLDATIAADPAGTLGAGVAERFGRLPYLLKVLSIAQPLSIQVHPSLEQARRGFETEEAAGVPLHDQSRTFKDSSHKPEMLVALSPLTVLSGFRLESEVANDLRSLGGEQALALAATLDSGGFATFVESALGADHGDTLQRLAALDAAAGTSLAVAAHAARVHPGDGGALVALAMNSVTLAPGEALYTPAGIVHCYVSGMGVEIMANSDNVVRAGLTTKAVNAPLLRELAMLRPTAPARPAESESGGGRHFATEVEEFGLSLVRDGEANAPVGPRIVVAIEGEVQVTAGAASATLGRGEAVFVAAHEGPATVSARGLAIVASVRGARG